MTTFYDAEIWAPVPRRLSWPHLSAADQPIDRPAAVVVWAPRLLIQPSGYRQWRDGQVSEAVAQMTNTVVDRYGAIHRRNRPEIQ